MTEIDERAQQEAEESRMMEGLAVLQRVRNSVWFAIGNVPNNDAFAGKYAKADDIAFLAAELGLSTQFKQEK